MYITSSVIVSIKYNSYSVYLLIADSCPHVAPPCDPHPWSPMTSAMALGSRNFADSNTAELMPLRTAILVLLKMVPPLVRQNPRHLVNCGGGRRNPESKSCVSFSNGRWRKKTHTRVTRYTMQGGTCNTSTLSNSFFTSSHDISQRQFCPKDSCSPMF